MEKLYNEGENSFGTARLANIKLINDINPQIEQHEADLKNQIYVIFFSCFLILLFIPLNIGRRAVADSERHSPQTKEYY